MERYSFGSYSFKGGDILKGGPANKKYTTAEDYRYDERYAQQLLDTRQYSTFEEYQSNFEFNDIHRRRAHDMEMRKLRHDWNIERAVYNRASENKDYKDAVEFWDAMQTPGGIGSRRRYLNSLPKNGDGSNQTNSYMDEVKDLVKSLGGEDSQAISVTFKPKKQVLLNNKLGDIPVLGGLLDIIDRDNENNIDNFYATSGLTKEDLEKYHVSISEKDDGSTELTFDKGNDLAYQILYNTYKSTVSRNYQPIVLGVKRDEEGNLAYSSENTFNRRDIAGLRPYLDLISAGQIGARADLLTNGQGNFGKYLISNVGERVIAPGTRTFNAVIDNTIGLINRATSDRNYMDWSEGGTEQFYSGSRQLSEIGRKIDEARFKSDEIYGSFDKELTVSTLVGGELFDGLSALNAARQRGEVDDTEYWKQRNMLGADRIGLVKAMGSANYDFYSNAYNENEDDETVYQLDNSNRAKLLNYISGVDESRLNLFAGMMDGQVGTWIVVSRPVGKNLIEDAKNFFEGEGKTDINVFVPGLFTERAQTKIDNDTSTRATFEMADMQKWEYDYQTNDGLSISYNPKTGYWKYGNSEILEKDAHRIIERDMMAEDGEIGLKYEFMNANGAIIDTEAYRQFAMQMAVAAGNKLYEEDLPPLAIEDIKDIFNRIFLTDNYGYANEIDSGTLTNSQFDDYYRYADIAYIFNRYMSAIETMPKVK